MNNIDDMIRRQVELVLAEDIGPGDITTLATIEQAPATAEIIAKSDGVMAGLPVVATVFEKLDENVEMKPSGGDGDRFEKNTTVLSLEADSHAILVGERTALNFLGHLSGIATLTSQFVRKVSGTGVKILDTRKTTPGLRYLEKYAVACGGGANHRFGLYDMALIKDNHITAAGSITEAVEKMRRFLEKEDYRKEYLIDPKDITIEVEVVDEDQLREAIAAGVTRILLDNQSVPQLEKMVALARSLSEKVKLEASGNVNLDNVRTIAESGVDFISIGALTHSAAASDFSLRIVS